jgi:hypothetical protein
LKKVHARSNLCNAIIIIGTAHITSSSYCRLGAFLAGDLPFVQKKNHSMEVKFRNFGMNSRNIHIIFKRTFDGRDWNLSQVKIKLQVVESVPKQICFELVFRQGFHTSKLEHSIARVAGCQSISSSSSASFNCSASDFAVQNNDARPYFEKNIKRVYIRHARMGCINKRREAKQGIRK